MQNALLGNGRSHQLTYSTLTAAESPTRRSKLANVVEYGRSPTASLTFILLHLSLYTSPANAGRHSPSTQEKISGATIVASLSTMNFGVLMPSLPQVIFSFGTAPE